MRRNQRRQRKVKMKTHRENQLLKLRLREAMVEMDRLYERLDVWKDIALRERIAYAINERVARLSEQVAASLTSN